jgi:hypothetical protein
MPQCTPTQQNNKQKSKTIKKEKKNNKNEKQKKLLFLYSFCQVPYCLQKSRQVLKAPA